MQTILIQKISKRTYPNVPFGDRVAVSTNIDRYETTFFVKALVSDKTIDGVKKYPYELEIAIRKLNDIYLYEVNLEDNVTFWRHKNPPTLNKMAAGCFNFYLSLVNKGLLEPQEFTGE